MEHLLDDFELLEIAPTDDLTSVRKAYAQLAKSLKQSGETELFDEVREAYTRIQKYLMQQASKQQEAQGIEKSFNEIQLGNTQLGNSELDEDLSQHDVSVECIIVIALGTEKVALGVENVDQVTRSNLVTGLGGFECTLA